MSPDLYQWRHSALLWAADIAALDAGRRWRGVRTG